MGGANFGGAQITQEGTASIGAGIPLSLICARTGPSEMSSCQPSLFAQCLIRALFGEFDFPTPPNTSKRPCRSVLISPNGTVLPRNFPVLKRLARFGPWRDLGPGSMIKLLRFTTVGFLLRLGSVCA